MSKVKYLVGRIKNMNFKKMFDTIDDIHNRTDKSKIFLFFDMIICAIKYQSGYVDYLLFEMWNLNSKERKTVLTRGKNNIFYQQVTFYPLLILVCGERKLIHYEKH